LALELFMPEKNNIPMRYLHLNLILRRMFRQKLHSAIILGSLTVGLAVAAILYGFIDKESKTDHFHTQKDHTYRLLSDDPFSKDPSKHIPYITNEAAGYLHNFPEVEKVCRMTQLDGNGNVLEYKETHFAGNMVVAVDSTFFSLFDFPLLNGNMSWGPDEMIVTKPLAMKLFGTTDVLGKEISLYQDTSQVLFTVAGVFKKREKNTHFNFDALVPFQHFEGTIHGAVTYLSVNAASNIADFKEKLTRQAEMPSLIGKGKSKYFIQPLTEVYFDEANKRPFTSVRNARILTLGWVIIALVLSIAIFNFLNLYVTSLMDRVREFGVKKVLGATAVTIGKNALVEVSLFLFTALALAVLVLYFIVPEFNRLFTTNLSMSWFANKSIIAGLALLFVFLLILISAVLSLYMNKVRPVGLITDKKRYKFQVSNTLFTLQFVVSMGLVFCALMVIRQVRYIENKSLGFDREVVEIRLPRGDNPEKLKVLKQELANQTGYNIEKISVANGNPVSGNWILRHELSEDEHYSAWFLSGDEDLLTALGLSVELGNSPWPLNDSSKIVNEQFVRYFDLLSPHGEVVPGTKGEQIAGIVADFNVSSLKQEVPLYMIGYSEKGNRLLVNYRGRNFVDLREDLGEVWSKVFPDTPFQYSLLGDELKKKHQEDYFLADVTIAFALVSIIVSCFGLFALARHHCKQKGQEMAIRKVMGANVRNVIFLLATHFGKWLLLSYFIAATIGYYFTQQWLETFAYRAEITWWVFALTAVLSMAIALISVGAQTLSTAVSNPVDRLRSE